MSANKPSSRYHAYFGSRSPPPASQVLKQGFIELSPIIAGGMLVAPVLTVFLSDITLSWTQRAALSFVAAMAWAGLVLSYLLMEAYRSWRYHGEVREWTAYLQDKKAEEEAIKSELMTVDVAALPADQRKLVLEYRVLSAFANSRQENEERLRTEKEELLKKR